MRFTIGSCWFLLVAIAGCGINAASIPPPPTVEVSGKAVLSSGQPITSGKINFSPPEGSTTGAEAYGTIGSDGTFKLQSFGGKDGVMPGTYKVSVRTTNNTTLPGVDPKFANGNSSTITVTITKETKDVGTIKFQ